MSLAATMPEPTREDVAAPPTFTELLRAFLKVGLLSFGGPAAQIAMMHTLIVDERRWLSEGTFLRALNLCTLLPGPEAQQLATYCGWRLHGVRGGLAAGILFVAPGAILMLALATAYVLYGKLGLVPALFAGIKAGVLAIVVAALIKIARRALKSHAAWAIAAAAFVALFAFGVPFPLVIVAAGLAGWATRTRSPSDAVPVLDARPTAPGPLRTLATTLIWLSVWLAPTALVVLALGPSHVLGAIGLFFAKLAVVTFGGAYAVLAYMAQQAVEMHGWLTAPEMLDGLGLAETTPGPLILVTQFVGFLAGYRHPAPLDPLAGGVLAALLTTWTTFAPSFLWIFVLAPFVDRLERMPALSAALTGITAAVVGVILNLSLWFALRVLFAEVTTLSAGPLRLDVPSLATLDGRAAVIAFLAAVALFRFHLGVATVVGLSAAAGLALHLAAPWLAAG